LLMALLSLNPCFNDRKPAGATTPKSISLIARVLSTIFTASGLDSFFAQRAFATYSTTAT